MNINIKFIILGGIVLLILLATHRNPAQERHEKALAEKAAHPDALIYSIEQHNKKNAVGRATGYSGLTPTVPSSGNPGNPGVSGRLNTPGGQNSQYMNPTMQPYYNQQNNNSAGYNQQYYGQPATNSNQGGQQQNNGYYPPPPLSNGSGGVQAPPISPRSMNATTLDNGQRLAFSGSRVYQVGSDGAWKPMSDGIYKMASGMNLVVRSGKKAIINN